jgi:hypothetical protein
MIKYFTFLCFVFLNSSLLSQNFPDLNYSETGNIDLFYSDNTEDDAYFIGMITHEANLFFERTLDGSNVQANLLVLNPSDWGKYAVQGAIYGMPHFKNKESTIIVAAEDNSFWNSLLPDLNKIPSPHKDLIPLSYTMQDGTISARNFFDLLTIHELAHIWSNKNQRTVQRLWLEEVFCNLALHTFIAEERSEWLGALTVLPTFHALNNELYMEYTTLASFEADYNKIAIEYPHNYGWYQLRFHNASRLIYNEGGAEVVKNLWDFLGKYKHKLSDEELNAKLSSEVHPYFKTLIEEW